MEERIKELEKLVLAWQDLANEALFYSTLRNDKSWNAEKEKLDKQTEDAGIVKTRDDPNDLNEAADAKAREQIAIEMHSIGVNEAVVIWTLDAYLDTEETEPYAKVAKHFGVAYDGIDPAPVNDALLARYEQLFEEAKSIGHA